MRKQRSAAALCAVWGLLVLLTVPAFACLSDMQSVNAPAATGDVPSEPTATPTTTVPPSPAPTPVEPAARGAHQDPMVRIAERVPGFGGVFLDRDQGVVYVYLQDAAMQERAERVLADVFGSDLLENREVRVLQGDYSMTHLDAWYRKLGDVIWQVPGVMMTDLDEKANRIAIHMEPRRGGRDEMEAAIASVDVPRPAVVVEVGCEGIPQWPPGSRSTPSEAFLQAINYSLEVPPEAPYGETIRMTLTLENASEEPVSFHTGVSPHNIVVTTPDGEQVWHWKCAKIFPAPLITETLDPGQTLEFTGEWEQVDNRGEPAPLGVYLVQGVFDLDYPEQLVTPPREVKIVRK